MAVYGLQTKMKEKILKEYFGINEKGPDIEQKCIYIGLGLTQIGAETNIESFNELFDGENYDGYCRARCIFGDASNCKIANVSDTTFQTAEEDWTTGEQTVSMIGLYDTLDVEDEAGKKILPVAVLKLPSALKIHRGETLVFYANSIVLNLTDE